MLLSPARLRACAILVYAIALLGLIGCTSDDTNTSDSSNNSAATNNGGTNTNNGTTSANNNGTTSANNGGTSTNNGSTTNTNNGTTTGTNNGTTAQGMTWHRDVRPIVESRCLNCHLPGGIAPEAFEMGTFEQIKAMGQLIKNSVESERMPPWQAQDGCNDYIADISLSTEQVEAIRTWVDTGMEEGDPADFVAIPDPRDEMDRSHLAETPDFIAQPPVDFQPNAGVSDDYRCFPIDTGFDTTRYMTGFDIEVDNVQMLHHVVVYLVPGDTETRAELDALEAEDGEPGYTCYGGPRTSSTGVGLTWAPGSDGMVFPEGMAMPIEEGTQLVMQMHYYLPPDGSDPGTDRSSARLWLMPEGQTPTTYAYSAFVGNLPFEIAAGANGLDAEECDVVYATLTDGVEPPANGINARDLRGNPELLAQIGQSGCVQQELYYNFPIDIEFGAIAPHMHSIAKSIKIEVDAIDDSSGVSVPMPDDPGSVCAADVPKWDFDWQRAYIFRDRHTMPRKGVIRLTCRYDNSLGTEPVRLGDGTDDEMCLGVAYLMTPFPIF